MDRSAAPRERKRLRLPEFDYSTPGAYFFTVVTVDRTELFGRIRNDAANLNRAGAAVLRVWRELPVYFPTVELDHFVVMPNHVHGIVWLGEAARGAASAAPALPKVLRAFKSRSAREVNTIARREGALWQRSFYERVIRDDEELQRFRKYIGDNPARWSSDDEQFAD